jgi:hypothetical protein
MTPFSQSVTRADGRTIDVVQRRGHLSYCYDACCCGRTDRGYAAVPVEIYKEEWLKRKLRNIVHMTKGGCLGPCPLANVASLEFDGQSVFFQSVSQPWQIRLIFDYIESMIRADRFLPPPPELAVFAFDFYDWNARELNNSQDALSCSLHRPRIDRSAWPEALHLKPALQRRDSVSRNSELHRPPSDKYCIDRYSSYLPRRNLRSTFSLARSNRSRQRSHRLE